MIPLQSMKNFENSKQTEPTIPFILVYIFSVKIQHLFVHHEKEKKWNRHMENANAAFSRFDFPLFFYVVSVLCPSFLPLFPLHVWRSR